MQKFNILLFLISLQWLPAFAQDLKGLVLELDEQGVESPLPGTNIYWQGSTTGTIADENGTFSIPRKEGFSILILSFIGYNNDTIQITDQKYIRVTLASGKNLDEVTIKSSASFLNSLEAIKTEVITSKELLKAACCNLSESFETNASVDVSFSNAVSGAKQIQMLGLDGTYSQIMIENIPFVRGLANSYGLSYIPGTWISSIDVGKGAGSVLNGYESMTGQINVELKKPENSEPFFLNLYGNSMGRLEANVTLAHKLNDRWSTGILLHGSNQSNRVDENEDSFLETPLFTQINGLWRMKYQGERFTSQFGVKALSEERTGGQTSFRAGDKGSTSSYGFGDVTRRYEVFAKNAILFPHKPYMGLGLITSGTYHDQDAFFGLNDYSGNQKTVNANLIFQSIIGNSNHQYKTGLSYLFDAYDEQYNDSTFTRQESVPGLFFEYTFHGLDKFTLVAGYRMDHHNLYGTVHTPRFHALYDLNATTAIRLSAGRGFRVPNVYAENFPLLISARRAVVEEEIRPEIAWNMGASINKTFYISDKVAILDLEFFRTQFNNQLIADRDTDPNLIRFYNLEGRSFANSFQAEVSYDLSKSLSMKTAYKFYDVRASINGALREVPMIAKNRFFINASYVTRFDIWKVDFTAKWVGAQRLPDGTTDSPALSNKRSSQDFLTINTQVTKAFRKWEIYVGIENLGNFKQKNPILGSDDPFGTEFDASMIWGPIIGRMYYAGLRLPLNK